MLEETGDLDQQTIIDTLEGSQEQMDFEEKAVNIARFVKNLESDIPGIDAEIKRLQAMKKSQENTANNLRNYLKMQMETSGIDKIKRDKFNIYTQNNKPSLVIDETIIPVGYTRIESKRVVDREAIEAAIKAGRSINGVVSQQGKSLQIR